MEACKGGAFRRFQCDRASVGARQVMKFALGVRCLELIGASGGWRLVLKKVGGGAVELS